VSYQSWDGRILGTPIPSLELPCLPGVFLQPPRDLRTDATGSGITLTWLPPLSPFGVDGYEIFRAPGPTDFTFAAPEAVVYGVGTLAWTDPRLAPGFAPGEAYYVARSFNLTLGAVSETGNTAGAITVDLAAGWHALSYPLEPFAPTTAAALRARLGAVTFLEVVGGRWVPAAADVRAGAGYFAERPAGGLFTWTGRPAAMIRFRDGFGFGYANPEAPSLRATVVGSDVALTWSPVAGAGDYEVHRSATRDGFFYGAAGIIARVTAPGFTDLGALPAGDAEVYYQIVPRDPALAAGGSSYSLGVVRRAFGGSTAFGLPLKPLASETTATLAASLGAFGILWFDVSAGVWVPHFRSMGPGVYDAAVVRGLAYQASVRVAVDHVFLGW
jgi:hypothetical protein